MSAYKTLNRTICAKVETTSGTDAAPTVGANAILIEAPVSTPNFGSADTREVTGTLDRRASIPAGGDKTFGGKVYLKGSGTAGTAPEVDPLLKGAALGLTTLAADLTGTAQGGAASTITLAAGASSTNNAYRYMVIETTGGTGPNQTRIIVGYVGSTKVATVSPAWTTAPDSTTTYAIRACSLYTPLSTNVPSVTAYDYHHRNDGGNSKLKKTLGGAGNVRLTMVPKGLSFWDIQYRGIMVADADVTNPGAATYQAPRPPPFMGAKVYLGDTQVPLNSLTVDSGNTYVSEDDPNQPYGTSAAGITDRAIGGTMRLPKTLESARNVFASWAAGTKYSLTAIWGSTAGNRFAVCLTNIIYSGLTDEDVQGFNYDSLPFRIDAADDGFAVCYW